MLQLPDSFDTLPGGYLDGWLDVNAFKQVPPTVKRQQSPTQIRDLCATSANDISIQITDLSKSVDFEIYYHFYY